jgi:hypothetical protein
MLVPWQGHVSIFHTILCFVIFVVIILLFRSFLVSKLDFPSVRPSFLASLGYFLTKNVQASPTCHFSVQLERNGTTIYKLYYHGSTYHHWRFPTSKCWSSDGVMVHQYTTSPALFGLAGSEIGDSAINRTCRLVWDVQWKWNRIVLLINIKSLGIRSSL